MNTIVQACCAPRSCRNGLFLAAVSLRSSPATAATALVHLHRHKTHCQHSYQHCKGHSHANTDIISSVHSGQHYALLQESELCSDSAEQSVNASLFLQQIEKTKSQEVANSLYDALHLRRGARDCRAFRAATSAAVTNVHFPATGAPQGATPLQLDIFREHAAQRHARAARDAAHASVALLPAHPRHSHVAVFAPSRTPAVPRCCGTRSRVRVRLKQRKKQLEQPASPIQYLTTVPSFETSSPYPTINIAAE